MDAGRAIWKYTECFDGIFSPNIANGTCTFECGEKNKNDHCETRESDYFCSCFDDIGNHWKANETQTAEHECSEYQPNLNGMYLIGFLFFYLSYKIQLTLLF